jgi:hypothetical protein
MRVVIIGAGAIASRHAAACRDLDGAANSSGELPAGRCSLTATLTAYVFSG